MNQESIIEKIKKLLEINRANGATEAEEAAAMERANVLMTKYQIEKHQLRGGIKTKNIHIRYQLPEWTHSFEQFHVRIGEFFGYHLNNGRNCKMKQVDYDSYIAGDKKGNEFVIVENNMIA